LDLIVQGAPGAVKGVANDHRGPRAKMLSDTGMILRRAPEAPASAGL